MKTTVLALLGVAAGLVAQAQPTRVPKTNPLPVYVHYMPWFDTPATSGNGQWGWHWTMDNRNPNVVVDPATGKRQIASHFYPLIGPYASSDPDVVEYHLLLMKLSGIDGVLVDWYGAAGTNGDLGNLLRNSNALIDRTDDVGLKFGLILEDRFTATVANGRTNLAYARDNYFNRPEYIRYGAGQDPLVGVFGPITFNQPSQWTEILSAAGEDVEFLTLWDNNNAGANADGQYVWPYEDENLDNFYSYMEAYYRDRAPRQKTVLGVAYPGFRDFYAQGQNGGRSYFDIPHNNGQTLNQTLGLVDQYRANIDMLQLATWNDFGEGTIFEPTQETGFSYLTRVQQYTGVPYSENDLRQVLRLYNLRKRFVGDAAKQNQLNQAFGHFVALRLPQAVAALDAAEGTAPPPPPPPVATVYKDINYGGYAVGLPVGRYNLAALQAQGVLNDDITAVRVASGYQVTFYEHDNFQGATLTRTADDAWLGASGWNDRASSVVVNAAPAPSSVLIQAENYSAMQGVVVEPTTDAGGGQNVGYLHPGDWMSYHNITFPTTGQYTIEYRVATGASSGRFSADLNGGAVVLGTVNVPGTGGWQTWTTVTQTVTVNAGTYNFGIYVQVGDWNLNWIRITKAGSARTAATVAPASSGSQPAAQLRLYPNPATDRLHLSPAPELAGSPYLVLNATGRVVSRGCLPDRGTLDVARLPAGSYVLVVNATGRQPLRWRFTKQ